MSRAKHFLAGCGLALAGVAVAAPGSSPLALLPSETLRAAFPAAGLVAPYTPEQVGAIIAKLLTRAAPPRLAQPVELTPNAPWSADGSHLSVWKPSFVLGTAAGGEIGINFWNLYNGGHINVGFVAISGTATLLDCRIHSQEHVSYKIYVGAQGELGSEGESKLTDGHLLLLVPGKLPGPTSVELWPSPVNSLLALTGCTLWAIPAA